MGFALDPISLKHMWGCHPDLIAVVKECADKGVMPFTFGVSEGLRTVAQQKLDVASGRSTTMDSRHLDGHAMDLVTIIHGKVSWAWPPYYVLADQIKAAAIRCNISIEWGGAWGTDLSEYEGSAIKSSAEYLKAWHEAHPNHQGGPLLDGPHIQLPRSKYPSGVYVPPSA